MLQYGSTSHPDKSSSTYSNAKRVSAAVLGFEDEVHMTAVLWSHILDLVINDQCPRLQRVSW